jgi:hypothetical protein
MYSSSLAPRLLDSSVRADKELGGELFMLSLSSSLEEAV